MANSQDSTNYNLYIAAGNQAAAVNVQISAVSNGSYTDSDFLTFVQAFLATFPAEWGVSVESGTASVSKGEAENTIWSPDWTQNPPVFQ